VAVVEASRLLLRKHHHPPGPVGEPLEHPALQLQLRRGRAATAGSWYLPDASVPWSSYHPRCWRRWLGPARVKSCKTAAQRDRDRRLTITRPLHSDRRWQQLRDTSPAEWADTVAFDRAIRAGHPHHDRPAPRGRAFLHRSLVPLDRVDLHPTPGRGSAAELGDGFGNECLGVCGT
jgi:hypothetical protein